MPQAWPRRSSRHVLKYLTRYTHRVAISNRRIQSFDNGKVSFSWKDYAHGNQKRTMTLSSVEFIRRFLLHVLPTGFMRIRYYGFLANRHRAEKSCSHEYSLPTKRVQPKAIPKAPNLRNLNRTLASKR